MIRKFTFFERNHVYADNRKKSLKFKFFKEDPEEFQRYREGGGDIVGGNEVKVDSAENNFHVYADVYGRVVVTRTKLYLMNSL